MSVTVVTPATNQNLTTQATVKSELGIPSATTEHDVAIDRLIGVVSAQIASALGLVLGKEGVTEARSPHGRARMLLTRTPILSVSAIRLDGTAIASTDYEIEDKRVGSLYRRAGWGGGNALLPTASITYSPERGEELWEIDYVGGYWLPGFSGSPGATDVLLPPDIEQLAIDLVTQRFRARGREPGLASESLGDWSASYRAGSLPQWDDVVARCGRVAS